MDRRAALKALLALPTLASLAVVNLLPADVIVVECDEVITPEGIAHIKVQIANIWPDHKVIVFDKGFHPRFTRNTVLA